MELRKKSDDVKIITAIACLFIGFFFIWNITAHISHIYELHLDAETCDRVKTLGMMPSPDCTITAPFQPLGLSPLGFLTLPGGNDIQVAPVAASQLNQRVEWSTSMEVKFWAALLFWAASLGLLVSVFRDKK